MNEQLAHDVALANRIVHAAGLVTAMGHVSARVPGTGTFLIPPRASPALAQPGSLLLIDTDGNILDGAGEPNSEFWIHARIYAARADVGSVAHVHPPSCVTLAQIGETVRPMHNSAALFDPVPVYERVGLIRDRVLGDDVASALGASRAILLRGHGANVVAADVRRATVLACYLEESADRQVRALAAAGGDGRRLRYFTAAEIARVREQLDADAPYLRAWTYYAALTEFRGSGSFRRSGSTSME